MRSFRVFGRSATFWHRWVSAAYLKAYFEASRAGAHTPKDYEQARVLLDRLLVAGSAVDAGRPQFFAQAKPGEEVTFYSGAALDRPTDAEKDRMKEVARVTADENGEATASIRVRRKSDMGGVIFKAVPDGSGDALYSDRIGVIKLDDEGGDDVEEATDEE